jgi:hypothetical protein
MFERYTESARRVLFFSRYEAAQLGSLTIQPEHVLLGVLREAPNGIERFMRSGGEALRHSLGQIAGAPQARVSTSVEVPFSEDTKLALRRAAAEADELKNHFIAPEHLVLGILVASSGAATEALRATGLDADALRGFLRTAPDTAFVHPDGGAPAGGVGMVAHAVSGGARSSAVLRQWRGVVKPGRAEDYLRHLHEETLPALARLAGFITVTIARREIEDGTEFQVTTVWRSLDDIRAFAGDDVTAAVVPPAAAALMVRYDDRAVHYEIVA